MYIEKPLANQNYIKPDETKLTLVGWAVANDTNAKLQILIDGNVVNSNITRVSRADVDKAVSGSYGGTQETPKAGFQSTIDITNYSTGKHTIKLRELSRNSELLSESEVTFSISNKTYSRKNVHRKTHFQPNIYKTRYYGNNSRRLGSIK